MHVIHLIYDLSIIGGPTKAVPELCNGLLDEGLEVELFATKRGTVNQDGFRFNFREFPIQSRLPLGLSPLLLAALRDAARQPVVMHSHSMWTMPCIYPSQVARNSQARAMNSPRGTLAPWAFRWHRWRKAAAWQLLQRKALQQCACLHATSDAEYQDIRSLGLTPPVAIIPNAIPMPEAVDRVPPNGNRPRRALFMGRMHPVKGLDTLLKSWRLVQDDHRDWELHLVGPDDYHGYPAVLKQQASELGCQRVHFVDELKGAAQADAYRAADLFLLPSHTENFGMVVAEALSHGVPALVCKGAPWQGLERHGCGWWVDQGEQPIATALREAFSHSDGELREKGIRGRAWAENDFSKKRISQMMRDTYAWILGGSARPDWVRD